MCMYSDYPYNFSVSPQIDKPFTIIQTYILTSPIRDRVPCDSGPAEAHVVLVGNDTLTVYIDLYVVVIQLILLTVLLIIIPLYLFKKRHNKLLATIPTLIGIFFAWMVISATKNHVGWQLIVPGMQAALLILLIPSLWIYEILNTSRRIISRLSDKKL